MCQMARTRSAVLHGSSPCLLLVSLALFMASLASAAECPSSTDLQSSSDTTGHFLFASITWERVEGNTVMFEITSAWRRKHHWPCKKDEGFNGPDGWPGLGQELSVVGLSMVSDAGEKRQEAAGQVASKFYTGDGIEYDLSLKVTSFSIKEDWLMGVSFVQHTYKKPQHSVIPFYPPHYVASPGDKSKSQPYHAVPWRAEFLGCCRQYKGRGNSFNFGTAATIDLDDHVASPRIVTMPFQFVYPDTTNRIALCALSVAGKPGMVMKTNGTINYPQDDNTAATYHWSVESTTDATFIQDAKVNGQASTRSRCAILELDAVYKAGQRDYISVGVTLGNALVTADMTLTVLPEPPGTTNVLYALSTTASYFGCPRYEFCEYEQSFGKVLPAAAGLRSLAIISRLNDMLEVRYVISTGKHASSLVATQQNNVQYSATIAGEDHQALPTGATWNPVTNPMSNTGELVTGIDVQYSASDINTRPLVDVPISHEHRDYTAVAELGPDMYSVADSNFNKLTGGATVTILLEKMTKSNDGNAVFDHSRLAAITRVVLASDSQVAQYLDDGFTKVDKNLLQQSNRGAVYIMYKRGSGVPVLDIRTSAAAGYTRVSTSSSTGAIVSIYVHFARDVSIARTLNWKPCTGQDEEYIVCASVAAWNASEAYSTPQQCMLLDIVATKPPVFVPVTGSESDKVLHASMGKMLALEMRVRREDLPLAPSETVPSIRFSAINGQPRDEAGVSELLTARTRTLARIVPPSRVGSGLAPREDAGDSSLRGEFSGFIEWIPSPYQGGWEGQVCVEACLDTGLCPSTPMASSEVCSEQCYHVKVARCKWALQSDDSLIEIAPRFQTNWLQLWYLNPSMAHPDHASTLTVAAEAAQGVSVAGQPMQINIGRLYAPLWDDTLESVAQRFGMSVERLIQVNADLKGMVATHLFSEFKRSASNTISPEVCIVPDSCGLAR